MLHTGFEPVLNGLSAHFLYRLGYWSMFVTRRDPLAGGSLMTICHKEGPACGRIPYDDWRMVWDLNPQDLRHIGFQDRAVITISVTIHTGGEKRI